MVVDDEFCVREICVRFLRLAGYQVQAVASGEEALEAVSRRSYGLVILDLSLKGMDGLTTFNRLKTTAPDTKVVVISGSVARFQSELEDARKHGLLGVLPKPFALQDLSAVVESAFHARTRAA